MKARIKLNRMPDHKLLTSNPGTIVSASKIIIPFITSRNNPKVKMVRGKVIMAKIGRMIALIIPMTAATIATVTQESTVTPGIT